MHQILGPDAMGQNEEVGDQPTALTANSASVDVLPSAMAAAALTPHWRHSRGS